MPSNEPSSEQEAVMPEYLSLFIVKHPSNASREVALAEALAADKAIQALGLEPVGGSYAKEGDAIGAALDHVFEDDDA